MDHKEYLRSIGVDNPDRRFAIRGAGLLFLGGLLAACGPTSQPENTQPPNTPGISEPLQTPLSESEAKAQEYLKQYYSYLGQIRPDQVHTLTGNAPYTEVQVANFSGLDIDYDTLQYILNYYVSLAEHKQNYNLFEDPAVPVEAETLIRENEYKVFTLVPQGSPLPAWTDRKENAVTKGNFPDDLSIAASHVVVSSQDSLQRDRYVATELCQLLLRKSVDMSKSTIKQDDKLFIEISRLDQEATCNSLADGVASALNGISYEAYVAKNEKGFYETLTNRWIHHPPLERAFYESLRGRKLFRSN